MQTAGPSNFSQIALSNTVIADNFLGVNIAPSGAGIVRAALNRVELYNNLQGLVVAPQTTSVSARVAVENSVVDGSAATGISVVTQGGSTDLTSVMMVGTLISNNGNALVANGDRAHLRIGQSTVAGNTATWQVSNGGVFQSYGDNYIAGNTFQPTPPVIARQ